jgi:hypothetical protein
MKMKNYTAIETLVCIVVLTVLPHLIRYLLPQINHESVLTCLARWWGYMAMIWPIIRFFYDKLITTILYDPILYYATSNHNVYLSWKWKKMVWHHQESWTSFSVIQMHFLQLYVTRNAYGWIILSYFTLNYSPTHSSGIGQHEKEAKTQALLHIQHQLDRICLTRKGEVGHIPIYAHMDGKCELQIWSITLWDTEVICTF